MPFPTQSEGAGEETIAPKGTSPILAEIFAFFSLTVRALINVPAGANNNEPTSIHPSYARIRCPLGRIRVTANRRSSS